MAYTAGFIKSIVIVCRGFVGLSNAVLFAPSHTVTALDIDEHKVNKLTPYQLPIFDEEIENFLACTGSNLVATTDKV